MIKPEWCDRVWDTSSLSDPLRWRKPARVFVNSMSDLFHESLPDEAIDRVSAERMIACTNACANIPHPEMLPWLMEAVRFVLDDVTRQALGDDTLPQVMASVNDLRRAYAAMMGEKP